MLIRFIHSLLFVSLAAYTCISHAQTFDNQKPYTLTWHTTASSYSPTQSIMSFTDDWDEPLQSGDYAFIQGRSDSQYRTVNSPMVYGLSYRYDYLLSFSESMAQAYWLYKNKALPKSNETYPLSLSANHNERIGFGLGYDFNVNSNWQLTPQVNAWYGIHAVSGDLTGSLTTLPSNSNQKKLVNTIDIANANLSYHYDTPALKEDRLGWQPNKPDGYGYSLDLHIKGQLPYQTELSIDAYDVFGRMHWQDMPMTAYNFGYAAMGRPPYTLEGKLDTNDFTQDLPWRVETTLKKQLSPSWSIGLQSEFNEVSDLHQLNASYQFNYKDIPLTVTGIVEPQTKSIGLQLNNEKFGIGYLTDDLNTNHAKRATMQLLAKHQW